MHSIRALGPVFAIALVVLGGCVDPGREVPASQEPPAGALNGDPFVACFDVLVPVGQPPISAGGARNVQTTMQADLFLPSTWPEVAVLLVPGGLADRKAWDGQSEGIGRAEGTTLPRIFANAGYAVVSIDRLSYAGSPLPGVDGLDIHPLSDLAALEQVINQLRTGAFTVGEHDCGASLPAPGPFEKVVAGGFSHGSFLLVDVLRARNATLDAAFLLAFSIYDAPADSTALAALCTARHGDPVNHRVTHFCDDFSPPFPPCVDWLTEPETRDVAMTNAACADVQRFSEPAGFAINPGRGSYGEHLPSLQPVPVYFLNGERDRVVGKGPGPLPPPSDFGPMFEEIRARCTCDATTVQMPGQGHMTLLHLDAVEQIEAIRAWLSAALTQ